MDSTEQQFKSKSERIRHEMSEAQKQTVLLEGVLDNVYSIKKESNRTSNTLSRSDQRQKKSDRVSNLLSIALFAATVYVSAYLEIIDQERLKQLLNAGYTFFTGV